MHSFKPLDEVVWDAFDLMCHNANVSRIRQKNTSLMQDEAVVLVMFMLHV